MTATGDTLVVSEVFGPTVQGEGPSTGRVASFVRLGGCNLSCTWCDTPYTWDGATHDLRAELARQPVHGILTELDGHAAPLVVATGGEPLLHQRQLAWPLLLDGIDAQGKRIEVETNGTITPSLHTAWGVDRFNVSPKLPHSGDTAQARIRPDALAALAATGKAVFKFVARAPADVDQAAQLTTDHGIPPHQVWIMPEGTDPQTLIDTGTAIADTALAHRFNLTTRLHVLLWGDKRGR